MATAASGVVGNLAAELVEGVLPGVVQVHIGGSGRRGRGYPRGNPSGGGAGFVWSEDGLVMTNHHVVAAASSAGRGGVYGSIEVVLADDRSFGAEVVGESRRLDLALLRLRGTVEGLTALPVGDSDALRPGELIFAVGHPWGQCGAVTAGVVMGEVGPVGRFGGRPGGRYGGHSGRYGGGPARYVQTDALLAPGNSGGPLVNAVGEVVGVNAMISGSLSLAVPSNTARAWAAGGTPAEAAHRPRLGVGVRPVALPLPARQATGQEHGLLVVSVRPGMPASKAGLLIGDVLLSAGVVDAGASTGDPEALLDALARSSSPAGLRLLRGGSVKEVEVTLESGPEKASA